MCIIAKEILSDGKLIYVEEQLDQDKKIIRLLCDDKIKYSAIFVDKSITIQPYMQNLQLELSSITNIASIKNALVLGSAGCSLPRFIVLQNPQIKVDCIDINDKIIELAKKYFIKDLPQNQINIINEDAISFIQNNSNKYELIIVDIYNRNNIDTNIFKASFVTNLLKSICFNGVIAFNVIGLDKGKTNNLIKEFNTLSSNQIILNENTLIFYDIKPFNSSIVSLPVD